MRRRMNGMGAAPARLRRMPRAFPQRPIRRGDAARKEAPVSGREAARRAGAMAGVARTCWRIAGT